MPQRDELLPIGRLLDDLEAIEQLDQEIEAALLAPVDEAIDQAREAIEQSEGELLADCDRALSQCQRAVEQLEEVLLGGVDRLIAGLPNLSPGGVSECPADPVITCPPCPPAPQTGGGPSLGPPPAVEPEEGPEEEASVPPPPLPEGPEPGREEPEPAPEGEGEVCPPDLPPAPGPDDPVLVDEECGWQGHVLAGPVAVGQMHPYPWALTRAGEQGYLDTQAWIGEPYWQAANSDRLHDYVEFVMGIVGSEVE